LITSMGAHGKSTVGLGEFPTNDLMECLGDSTGSVNNTCAE